MLVVKGVSEAAVLLDGIADTEALPEGLLVTAGVSDTEALPEGLLVTAGVSDANGLSDDIALLEGVSEPLGELVADPLPEELSALVIDTIGLCVARGLPDTEGLPLSELDTLIVG